MDKRQLLSVNGLNIEHMISPIVQLKWMSKDFEFRANHSLRELLVVDIGGFGIKISLWGNIAKSFNAELDSWISFKHLKVKDYFGKSLSSVFCTSFSVISVGIPSIRKY